MLLLLFLDLSFSLPAFFFFFPSCSSLLRPLSNLFSFRPSVLFSSFFLLFFKQLVISLLESA
ncbi:hypothetical protein F4809DRAFT_588195 [Biscogniauxia mediterranea]|nr:hypothetical protein F4809DRAFT_588195 [Biscogniauxia mediterranea]